MSDLLQYITEYSKEDGLAIADALHIKELLSLTLYDVELAALQHGIKPLRYLRNNLSCEQQLRLFVSRVAIIGCGGLGGYVAEFLTRLGFCHLRLVDPDVFEEHNLNRQRFCTIDALGSPKSLVTAEQIRKINPAALPIPKIDVFSEEDINSSTIVVDALDNPNSRRTLFSLCSKYNRPLVHGAVREWFGQAAVLHPGSTLFEKLYPEHIKDKPSAPPQVIVPTVAHISSIQTAEVCKLVLEMPSLLINQWLSCDLKNSDFITLPS